MSKIFLSTTLYTPLHFVYAIAKCNDVISTIPNQNITIGDWGFPASQDFFLEVNSPVGISLVWYSFFEESFYEFEYSLDAKTIFSGDIVIGCSLFGNVFLWKWSNKKSAFISNHKAKCINDTIGKFFDLDKYTIKLCSKDIQLLKISNLFKEKLEDEVIDAILADKERFEKNIKMYNYRYVINLSYWNDTLSKWDYDNEIDEICHFDYIEESLFDGTHDKLHDGGLMKYHEAGKPKKLALKWHIKKSDYSAYFWFEDEEICTIFNKFYGQHPDTKTDFIIHIDPINKKYELSLYRYGLKEPVIIPESAYQLIVFKSGFENYRSENYNQPTGAWIW